MNRNFSDSQKDTIWNNFFGINTNSGTDPFGRDITRSNFEADHVYPFAKGGKTVVTNGMPLHPDSNTEKADDMSGSANEKHFTVQGTEVHGILNVEEKSYHYKGERK